MLKRVSCLAGVLGLLLLRAPGAAAACSTELFGGAAMDPVVISGTWELDPGCTLNFGDREVVLAGTLRAVDLTLTAGKLRVLERGSIQGGGGVTTIILRRGRVHDGSAEILGALESRGPHGGGIVVLADGAILAGPAARLDASATAGGGSGGFITLEGVQGITVSAGAFLGAIPGDPGAFGGAIGLVSSESSIAIDGEVRAPGGSDGPGGVSATAARRLAVNGPIHVPGRCSPDGTCSPGGIVRLAGGEFLEITAPIDAAGPDGAFYAGIGGGEVVLDSGGDLALAADVLLSGGADSRGGAFRARCDGNFIHRAGKVIASGRGLTSTASGGSIEVLSGGGAELRGGLQVNGALNGDAGSIRIEAEADVLVAAAVESLANYPTGGIEVFSRSGAIKVSGSLSARGTGPFGTGGPIALIANTDVDLLGRAAIDASGEGADGLGGSVRLDALVGIHAGADARLLARGDPLDAARGEGGLIDLTACRVVLDPGSRLDASGRTGGGVFVASSGGGLAMGSAVRAADGGFVSLRHAPGLPPQLGGASFDPAPLIAPSALIGDCVIPPACDPPAGLACSAAGTSVRLSWNGSPAYASIRILRDGAILDTVPGSQESFTDANAPLGQRRYGVQAVCLDGESAAAVCAVTVVPGVPFDRGDCNGDGTFDISDPVYLLSFLFQTVESPPSCDKTCDANDDGGLDISDPIAGLGHLFLGEPDLPKPFRACGVDPTADRLTCEAFRPCPAR